MSRKGFDPDRLADGHRERPVIPQILAPETEAMAKGFTEIKVVGLGGAGNNTIDRMIESNVQGIDFIAVNSDVQSLDRTLARKRVQIGERVTRGLGTGGDTRAGEKAAESAADALYEAFHGADMIFITAGLGGGTGSGAAPIVADIARTTGALTVGVVTMPFSFEGTRRRAAAAEALDRLRPLLDATIVIANDRLLAAGERLGIREAFRLADETLHHGIQGVADLILTPGVINLDFADVRSVMHGAGTAMMAMGSAAGEGRALRAVESALQSPLLEAPIDGARGILLNISGPSDLGLHEINEAAGAVASVAHPEANIIFGAALNPRLGSEVRVTIIATGFGHS
ncbi:MAG TPA: cell division protein FtsZ [Chloroflexota bacterium]|nr:cell division protein FtsZ [Chloroflexota bacterium]